MDGTPLNLYGAYQSAWDEYQRDLQDFQQQAQHWNDLYYSGQYDAMRAMGEPQEPTAPIQTQPQEQGQELRTVSPYELYGATYGRGTPDVLSNEAWSLQNISSPFLSSTPETAYDVGNVAKINNPQSYVGTDEMFTGQSDQTTLNTMTGQNQYY